MRLKSFAPALALFACLLFNGCSTVSKLHSQFGMTIGTNLGDDPQSFSRTRAVAELGYVDGGLKRDAPEWSFGGTGYLLLGDDPDALRPGIKAIARRHLRSDVSLDLSAGPMITAATSSTFDGFTAGVALNFSILTLRSEYVTWPFDAWDESRYSNGVLVSTEHHSAGHEAVWFNGLAFNGGASWWAFAALTTLVIIAGSQGAFE